MWAERSPSHNSPPYPLLHSSSRPGRRLRLRRLRFPPSRGRSVRNSALLRSSPRLSAANIEGPSSRLCLPGAPTSWESLKTFAFFFSRSGRRKAEAWE